MGIAQAPQDGTGKDLIQSAEMALEQAKHHNLPFAQYSADFYAAQRRADTIVSLMDGAMAHNELALHYQAQVCLQTGQVTGAEALLRWHHRSLGAIPPQELMPLAQASGKIDALETWVVRSACQQIKKWENTSLQHLRVSINLTPHQFQDASIIRLVEFEIKRNHIKPENLGIEITESEPLDHTTEAPSIIEYLQSTGIEISLDDFGTGYSAFSHIYQFPLNAIKLDKSTIKHIDTLSTQKNLVRSMIKMAHNMKLKVSAEGVETVTELRTLQSLGCDIGQGYFWNRPCSAEKFENWYKNYHSTLACRTSDHLVTREEMDALNRVMHTLTDSVTQ